MADPAPLAEALSPLPGTSQTTVPGSGGGTPPQASPLGGFLLPLLLMGVIMYFLMIRPERKKQKERKTMLDGLRKNDQVLTIGGILGTVASVGEDQVTLKVDEGKDIRIKVSRGAIQTVLKQAKGAEDPEKPGG